MSVTGINDQGLKLTTYLLLLHTKCLIWLQIDSETCSTEFEQIARQLEFKHQSQIFKLLPMNYD